MVIGRQDVILLIIVIFNISQEHLCVICLVFQKICEVLLAKIHYFTG